MERKIFEEFLNRLVPECSKESVQCWIAFANECVKMGQYPDFISVSDKEAAVGRWLDAIYKGLYRAKQKYGTKPIEQICKLAVKHSLYPWEMMSAAKYLKNGGDVDNVILLSVEGMLDECDLKLSPKVPEQKKTKSLSRKEWER